MRQVGLLSLLCLLLPLPLQLLLKLPHLLAVKVFLKQRSDRGQCENDADRNAAIRRLFGGHLKRQIVQPAFARETEGQLAPQQRLRFENRTQPCIGSVARAHKFNDQYVRRPCIERVDNELRRRQFQRGGELAGGSESIDSIEFNT